MKWKVVLPIIFFSITLLKFSGGVVFFYLSQKSVLLALNCVGFLIVCGLFAVTICILEFPHLWREIRAIAKKEIQHEIVRVKWFSRTCKKHL